MTPEYDGDMTPEVERALLDQRALIASKLRQQSRLTPYGERRGGLDNAAEIAASHLMPADYCPSCSTKDLMGADLVCPGCGRDYTEEANRACAWADYRKDYGVGERVMTAAHKAFLAGWQAAREGDQSGVLR